MATAESVKAKLQGLIDKANDTTGSADANLTNAVDRLCDGYGSGGGVEVVAQSKTVTPTKARQTVLPDAGYTHLSKVTVNAIPDKYIEPSGSRKITANGTYDVTSLEMVNVAVESGETKQYLHTITFTSDDGGEQTLTMTLVNNSSASLSGEYELEDTDIYNGAIVEGYESNGAVVGHYSNYGGGSCYLELEDGTQVNSFYGYYYDTVTEYNAIPKDYGKITYTQNKTIIVS